MKSVEDNLIPEQADQFTIIHIKLQDQILPKNPEGGEAKYSVMQVQEEENRILLL